MRSVLTALLLGGGLVAQQAPAPPVIVEVAATAASAFVHEPIELTVTIGADERFLAEQAVPLFQQKVDVPFHVTVPWLFAAEDRAVEPLAVAAGQAVTSIAVGDNVVAALARGQRVQNGRRYRLLELRYRWLPLAPGTSAIAPVDVRYAFATRFTDDFLRGRQPVDRQEAMATSLPLQLAVRPLPTAGRPANWFGAVGEFVVRASTSATAVAVGESFAVEVEVKGDGNLERFAALPPPSLPGFHVQGVVERRAPGVRTFVLDVMALQEGATAVPAIPFAAFSPRRGDYVVHSAGPVPIAVTAAKGALSDRVQELVDAEQRRQRLSRWYWLVPPIALLALLRTMLRLRRRRQRRREAIAAALTALERAREPEALLAAFDHLCAHCVGDGTFAGDATWSGLQTLGVPADAVDAARVLRGRLDGARFGGAALPRDELVAVAGALVRHADRLVR